VKEFKDFLKEQLIDESIANEYFRLDPFFSLGNQVLLLRKKLGITQNDLAKMAKTTQAVISRIENASTKTSLETAIRVAEAFNSKIEISITPKKSELEQKPEMRKTSQSIPYLLIYYSKQNKICCTDNDTLLYRPLKKGKEIKELEFA